MKYVLSLFLIVLGFGRVTALDPTITVRDSQGEVLGGVCCFRNGSYAGATDSLGRLNLTNPLQKNDSLYFVLLGRQNTLLVVDESLVKAPAAELAMQDVFNRIAPVVVGAQDNAVRNLFRKTTDQISEFIYNCRISADYKTEIHNLESGTIQPGEGTCGYINKVWKTGNGYASNGWCDMLTDVQGDTFPVVFDTLNTRNALQLYNATVRNLWWEIKKVKDKQAKLTYLGKVDGQKNYQLSYAEGQTIVTLKVDDESHDINFVGIEQTNTVGDVILIAADCIIYEHVKPRMISILLPTKLRYERRQKDRTIKIELTNITVESPSRLTEANNLKR